MGPAVARRPTAEAAPSHAGRHLRVRWTRAVVEAAHPWSSVLMEVVCPALGTAETLRRTIEVRVGCPVRC